MYIHSFLSQLIMWSLTFLLTSQAAFAASPQAMMVAAIPLLYSLGAIAAPQLVRRMPGQPDLRTQLRYGGLLRLLACIPLLLLQQPWLLAVLYFVHCLLFHAMFAYEVAYISGPDQPQQQRDTGRWQMCISLGKLAAPLLTAWVLESHWWRFPHALLLCHVLLLASTMGMAGKTMQQPPHARSLRGISRYRDIIRMSLYFIPVSLAVALYGILIRENGLDSNSFASMLALSALGNITGSLLYGKLLQQATPERRVILSSIAVGLGLISLGVAGFGNNPALQLAFSAFFTGIAIALLSLYIIALLQQRYHGYELLYVCSLNNGAQVGVSMAGPLLLPLLYPDYRAWQLFVASGMLVLAINLACELTRRQP